MRRLAFLWHLRERFPNFVWPRYAFDSPGTAHFSLWIFSERKVCVAWLGILACISPARIAGRWPIVSLTVRNVAEGSLEGTIILFAVLEDEYFLRRGRSLIASIMDRLRL